MTNREYLEFVRSGGYHDESRWTKEGWKWVQYREVKHPVFWVCTQRCKNGCGDKGGLSSMSHCVPEAFHGASFPTSQCCFACSIHEHATSYS